MKRTIVVILVFCLVLAFCTTVSAAASLNFTATRSYWQGPNKLAVEGYFQNTGTQTITRIKYFELTVYVQDPRTGEYYYLGQATFYGDSPFHNVYIYPGEKSYWTISVPTDSYPSFYQWRYKWYAEYDYLR